MNNKIKNASVLAGVLGGALLSGNFSQANAFDYNALGSGSELRSRLLEMNSVSVNDSKTIELACGEKKTAEAKCGEKKTAEAKCGEKKAESTDKADKKAKGKKTAEGKCGEGKCGEGKCGEKK